MYYLLIFLTAFSVLSAEEPLVVHLTRTSAQRLVYLDVVAGEKCGLEGAYLEKVADVLRFDFAHNGKTHLAQRSEEIGALFRQERGREFREEKWSKMPLHYVVRGEVKGGALSLYAYSVKEKKVRAVEGITLTGRLAEDRRRVHEASDALFEGLWGKKGIASTHVLYTQRYSEGSDSNSWRTEVWESDYDGANARQITHDGKLCVTPVYLPALQGKVRRFMYVSYKTGQPKLYLANLGDGTAKRVSYLRGNQLAPALSQRSDLVAFISDILGNPELFIQGCDGAGTLVGKPWQVTSLPKGAQGSPTFSPDGKRVAFVSNKDGAPRIYITSVPQPQSSALDLKLQLLTKQNRENTSPCFSPDGKKLVYSARTKGERQIWLYDFATGKEVQLTSGGGDKESPFFAPDSEHIVFHSTSRSGSELYITHIDDPAAIKISSGSGEKRFASWEPFSS